jgi:hypothetical protein
MLGEDLEPISLDVFLILPLPFLSQLRMGWDGKISSVYIFIKSESAMDPQLLEPKNWT